MFGGRAVYLWLCSIYGQVFFFLKSLSGTFVFARCKTKVLKKVWKKRGGFGAGKKDLALKGLFLRPDSSSLIYLLFNVM
jgi:hypothetical protein